jgi:hypothetical protein
MNCELSCYTSNLVACLAHVQGGDPAVRLGAAVRLAVRTDLPDGVLAFSHHHRIDRHDGRELAYRGTGTWPAARAELAREVDEEGAVLAVANARYLPWCPQYTKADVPHWILLRGQDSGCWQVADDFAALLPQGEQVPYEGELSDAELCGALTPPAELAREYVLRDVHALGTAVPLPPPSFYRWLAWQRCCPAQPVQGTWLDDLETVLGLLIDRFTDDPGALTRHTDDLWAAARHHRHRLAVEAAQGQAAQGQAAERQAAEEHPAAAAWRELPRSLRFAAESAARGRPRPGVIRAAFEALMKATVEERSR